MNSKMQKVIAGSLATFVILIAGTVVFMSKNRIERISIIGITSEKPDRILDLIGFRPGEVLLASRETIQARLAEANVVSAVNFQNNQLVIEIKQY